LVDDPALTVRDWSGRQPLRLVIDRRGDLPGGLKLLDGKHPTVLFSERKMKPVRNVTIVTVSPETDMLDGILSFLYENQIQSLIVEGGRETLQGFIRRNLWDEARVFTGYQLFGEGERAPRLAAKATEVHQMESSTLSIYRNEKNKRTIE
jgi:diaminohydroxyphosphoribosylaminopyrimidine deaminase/5-amino-6-(5-phosphoribosylamino)uracil reductase